MPLHRNAESVKQGARVSRRSRLRAARARDHGVQVISSPLVRLNVDGVQNAAALRYHT